MLLKFAKKTISSYNRVCFISISRMTGQQIWLLIWWLGMFLFGTYVFEEAINYLVTRNFKNLLKNTTNNLIKSISTGLLVTSVLQSSSVVSLIVLSFVGAWIIGLNSAVGIILWTNIGAPLTDIVLGNLGLKFSLVNIALPMIWIAGIWLLIFVRHIRFRQICKIVIGLWLIFLGLGYMKDSMIALSSVVDFGQYINLSIFVYFVVGLFVTLLMQSSSATVVLVLTATSTGIVDYRMWIFLIMWAFLGTTITAVLWAIGPDQIKKQVAFSHVFFNVFSAIIGFLLFPWIVDLLKFWFKDVVIGLSVFAIWFKIFCVLLLTPFVSIFTRFLKKLFPEKQTVLNLSIEKVSPDVTDVALISIKKDCVKLLKKVFVYIMHVWDVDEKELLKWSQWYKLDDVLSKQKEFAQESLDQQYRVIKAIEESLISFGAQIKKHTSKITDIQEVSTIYRIVWSTVYAAKYMKDVSDNIRNLEGNNNIWLYNQYKYFRWVLVKLYKDISWVIDDKYSDEIVHEIVMMMKEIKSTDDGFLTSLTKELNKEKINKLDLSDLLHVNRYVYLSSVSLLDAVKDLLLRPNEKEVLEQI